MDFDLGSKHAFPAVDSYRLFSFFRPEKGKGELNDKVSRQSAVQDVPITLSILLSVFSGRQKLGLHQKEIVR